MSEYRIQLKQFLNYLHWPLHRRIIFSKNVFCGATRPRLVPLMLFQSQIDNYLVGKYPFIDLITKDECFRTFRGSVKNCHWRRRNSGKSGLLQNVAAVNVGMTTRRLDRVAPDMELTNDGAPMRWRANYELRRVKWTTQIG